jgi:hypothetical protein
MPKMKKLNIITGEYEIIETPYLMPYQNNTYKQPKQMTYAQKLKEVKAKQQYKALMKKQRDQQIKQIKQGASKTSSFLKKAGRTTLNLGTKNKNKKLFSKKTSWLKR